jgi:hypothetical protein
VADVEAVAVRNKQARAFALGDALGERNLARLLAALDEELWEARKERDGGTIGVLYGLLSKVRAMLLAKALGDEGLIRPGSDYPRMKAQLEQVSADRFGTDRRYNPKLINPYVMFRAAQQAQNFTSEELVAALERLMQCGLDMFSTGVDGGEALQRALIEVCLGAPGLLYKPSG